MKRPIWLGSNEMIVTLRHVYRRAASHLLNQASEQMSAKYANLRGTSQTLQILWVSLKGCAALLPEERSHSSVYSVTSMDQSTGERVRGAPRIEIVFSNRFTFTWEGTTPGKSPKIYESSHRGQPHLSQKLVWEAGEKACLLDRY